MTGAMMTTIPTLDADPCGRAAALRGLRDKLMTGRHTEQVTYEGKTVRYAQADMKMLNSQIAEAEAACDRLNNRRGRRFVIGGRA
jgi:hypothetical protein